MPKITAPASQNGHAPVERLTSPPDLLARLERAERLAEALAAGQREHALKVRRMVVWVALAVLAWSAVISAIVAGR